MLLNKKKKNTFVICPFNLLFQDKLSLTRKSMSYFLFKDEDIYLIIMFASKMKLQVLSKNFINV